MKKLFFVVSCLIMMALTSCSEEREVVSQQPAGSFLVIEVADGSGGTRASYSGLSTTFEDGDALGLYVVDAEGNVMSDNVRFAKSGGSWSTATPVPFNPDWSYYAYYPYVESPYTPDFTTSGVDNQFATFIADASNKFHLTNQSTKANYGASDLMIAQGSLSGTNTAKFMLDHKKGLIIIHNGYNGAVAGYSAYNNGGKKYVLVKPDTDVQVGGETVRVSSGRYLSYAIDAEHQYLTFTAVEDGTFSFSKDGLSYSLDEGVTWTALSAGASTPTVTAGNTVMWKNNTTLTPTSSVGIGTFSSTQRFDVEGNIMSLYYGDDFEGKTSLSGKSYAFYNLFYERKVRDVSYLALPATILAQACYQSMFFRCSSLTTVPELPATTLAQSCYNSMFSGCTSLTTAPELPATTLAQNCYSYMFENCSSLTAAPELPATTLASGCYSNMFYSCTSLTIPPELPATTLVNGCYSNMFRKCTSLTTAPELPATTLTSSCYQTMFRDCSNLSYIKAAFTTTPSSSYTNYWVSGVKSTGTFVKNSAASWDVTGTSGVPSGWTIETYTP